jgi:hypothetical protein
MDPYMKRLNELAAKTPENRSVVESYELIILDQLKDHFDDHADMMNLAVSLSKCTQTIINTDTHYLNLHEQNRFK